MTQPGQPQPGRPLQPGQYPNNPPQGQFPYNQPTGQQPQPGQNPYNQTQPQGQFQQPQPNPYNQPYNTPYPPQPQRNPNGGYGAVPSQKPKMPIWGWIVIGLLGVAVVAEGVLLVVRTPTTVTVTPTVAAATQLTAASGQTPSAKAVVQPTSKAAVPATASANSSNSNKEVGIKVDGAGQELVGQKGTDNDLNVVVTKVERFSQLNDFDGKAIKPQGVFLVVSVDLENIGTEPRGLISMNLVDGSGKKFSSASSLDARTALVFLR